EWKRLLRCRIRHKRKLACWLVYCPVYVLCSGRVDRTNSKKYTSMRNIVVAEIPCTVTAEIPCAGRTSSLGLAHSQGNIATPSAATEATLLSTMSGLEKPL